MQFQNKIWVNIITIFTFQFINNTNNYQILGMRRILLEDFEPNQVVFIRSGKQDLKPAKIVVKCSYGTYKVKMYGSKDEEYASEYLLEPYSQQKAQKIQILNKKNKKLLKYLKTAQKDNQIFQQKLPEIRAEKLCKQEEQQLDQEINGEQKGQSNIRTKYQSILNIKVQTLIADHNNSKDTTFSYHCKQGERTCKEKPKWLMIQKLQWALEDICYGRSNLNNQITISQIMESNIIEPAEYLSSCLFKKLALAIDYLKKGKAVKLKNYLTFKQSNIIAGIQNYLHNYSLFLRVKQRYVLFLSDNQLRYHRMEQEKMNVQQPSFPELNLTK